ncbi:hypothetical protein ABPG75_012447 [Micractinium tetrahymenae]
MGRPFEPALSPRAGDSESSSEEEEGWVEEGSEEEEEWSDPTGGVLSRVFEAAESGDVDELSELTGRLAELDVSIDTRGADSDTPLHLAALYGHAECVRLLLERGARADVADSDGAQPLHDAAAGGYAAICEMLLEAAPGCIDRGDTDGDTPLHNAARGQHEAVVQLLVDRGADVSLQNDDFKTPVQLAERGSRCREILEAAVAAAAAAGAAAGGAPEPAPPAAEVA